MIAGRNSKNRTTPSCRRWIERPLAKLLLPSALLASPATAEDLEQPANDAKFQEERRLYENPPSAPPASASESATAGSPPQLETAESLAARVRTARALAAEQRRSIEATLPATDGLSQTQLTIRAAEQNLSIYDTQIFRGEGTDAIESFRELTLATLADARRQELFRVWGNGIYHPEAFDVLSDYGRSMAELRRIRFLAKARGLAGIAQQSDELMQQASAAFERDMRRLSDEVRDNPSFAKLSRELLEAEASGERR
jgi:hypothetical protein